MLTGNKGEWSELYVLISLLVSGELYQSDENFEIDINNVYNVIKAYKKEKDYELEFVRNDCIHIFKVLDSGEKIDVGSFSFAELKDIYEKLYKGIKKGKGASFKILEVQEFAEKAKIKKLKADSSVKSDIKLRIYDHRLAKEADLGFSIKSLIGSRSTLFNTGVGNNFIFTGANNLNESVSAFNLRTYNPSGNISKITYRLSELENAGVDLNFSKIQSEQLFRNLRMIDGDLPGILAWALYFRWTKRKPSLKEISGILERKDPLNFYGGRPCEQKLYEYKLKKFLVETAMGMTSEKPWDGEYDSFGGVIIAKSDGDILCFHIYDFNLLRNYLINNTVFEQPSTGEDTDNPGHPRANGKKYHYGWLIDNSDELIFKINLQVRFK